MPRLCLLVILLTCLSSVCVSSTKLSHNEALRRLRNAGIQTNIVGGKCTTRTNPSCTSFDQIRANTIAGLIALKEKSRCSTFIVTGGSEVHGNDRARGNENKKSHWNGYKADVHVKECLDNYIENTFAFHGTRSDGAAMYISPSNTIFAKELFPGRPSRNHWDIVFQ